eukprot:GHVT01060622.1.p1 GENE.GHVT01060622.1~~GHVT01060622.1.p1  ORF type:complete len:182 (+),score=23.54 GHVT01060622.1:657-1202(+)
MGQVMGWHKYRLPNIFWALMCLKSRRLYKLEYHPLFTANPHFPNREAFAGVRLGYFGTSLKCVPVTRQGRPAVTPPGWGETAIQANNEELTSAFFRLAGIKVAPLEEYEAVIKKTLKQLAGPGVSPPMANPPPLVWCGPVGKPGLTPLSPFALQVARLGFLFVSYKWLVDAYEQVRARAGQ